MRDSRDLRAHSDGRIRAGNWASTMHQSRREAAEQHELAARAHREAAAHHEKGDHLTGNWHAQLAFEYSSAAIELAQKADGEAERIEDL